MDNETIIDLSVLDKLEENIKLKTANQDGFKSVINWAKAVRVSDYVPEFLGGRFDKCPVCHSRQTLSLDNERNKIKCFDSTCPLNKMESGPGFLSRLSGQPILEVSKKLYEQLTGDTWQDVVDFQQKKAKKENHRNTGTNFDYYIGCFHELRKAYQSLDLESDPKEYLIERGFSDEIINLKIFGLDQGKKRILIPFSDNSGRIYNFASRDYTGDQKPKELFMSKQVKGFWGLEFINPKKALFITEGIFDALSIIQVGFPCIATCGSSANWKAIPDQFEKIKDLKEIIFFFDQEPAGREIEKKILKQLSQTEGLSTVKVFRVNRQKEGLDPNQILRDYGESKLKEILQDKTLVKVLNDFEKKKGRIAYTLDEMIEDYVFLHNSDEIFNRQTHSTIKVRDLRAFNPALYNTWLDDPRRVNIPFDGLVFKPGQEIDETKEINLFNGFNVDAEPGDCSGVIKVIKNLCGGSEEDLHFVLSWLAYPLRNIGTNMQTSLMFISGQGAGKNLIFEKLMGKIYQKHFIIIGQGDLFANYNSFMSRRLFILANEVFQSTDKRDQINKIKCMTNADKVKINEKYKKERVEDHYANWVFLSNNAIPLLLEDDDRRFAVFQTRKKYDLEFYREVNSWIENDGWKKFYNFLVNEYEMLPGFYENYPAPENVAKTNVIDGARDSVSAFYHDWQNGNLSDYDPIPFDFAPVDELFDLFSCWYSFNYPGSSKYLPGKRNFFSKLESFSGFRDRIRVGNGRFRIYTPLEELPATEDREHKLMKFRRRAKNFKTEIVAELS